jgi:hypothetical protein
MCEEGLLLNLALACKLAGDAGSTGFALIKASGPLAKRVKL